METFRIKKLDGTFSDGQPVVGKWYAEITIDEEGYERAGLLGEYIGDDEFVGDDPEGDTFRMYGDYIVEQFGGAP